jgi:nucleoside-diphosphate-sugar epimerase
VFIDDAVKWIRRVVETQTSGCFNLAGPENVTIRTLAERLAAILGKPAIFDVGRDAQGDRVGDIERITEVTGYAASYDIERGLRAMLGGQTRLAA